ncbi:MAG: choice-of-anchor D domain-containing protein, partial [Acidobacteriaceae bacterium]
MNVDFSPFAPGAVSGAIVITDPNGNILAEQDLPGMGTGPLVAFEPGVQSTVPAPATESGYQAPLGVAVDVNGDVFVADSVNNRVVEVQGGTTPVVLPATTPTLNSPFGVAVDGIGDVFAADTLNGRIVEWPWNAETQAYGTPVYIEGGLSEPAGVATDGYGNLYVADEGHNEVFAFPVQVGGTYGTAVALPFTGLHFPKGVFVDGNNNVFVADTGDGNIDELPWTGSGYGTQTTVVSNLIQPIAIAVDASGSIYTGNAYVGGVYQVPFNGTTYGAMNRLPITGLMSSIAVAVDLYGDVFVCDGLNNDVQELNVENEPVLNFATTSVGKTSTDSPKSATLTNIGNQALALDGSDGPNTVYPTDFPENTKATTLCASGTNVNPGSSCVVSANFTPLSPGNLSEGVVINDNNYGQAGNEDYITVNGTATGTANTAPTLSPAALDFGGVQIFTTSFPLEETVTNNTGSAITLPTISISQTGTNVFFLGTGTNQCTNGETLAVSASCNIYVTFSPTVSGQAYTGTLNVGSTSLTVALSGFGLYFNADVGNSVPGQEVSVLITKAGTPGTISV